MFVFLPGAVDLDPHAADAAAIWRGEITRGGEGEERRRGDKEVKMDRGGDEMWRGRGEATWRLICVYRQGK